MNLTPAYITGFCEGGAAFTFCRNRSKNGTILTQPRFAIRQRFDVGDVLEAIKKYWEVGHLYDCPARGRTKRSLYYSVGAKDDLNVIVDHFIQYPLVGENKRLAFSIWKDMVVAYCSRDQDEVSTLAATLTSIQLRPRGFMLRKKSSSVDIACRAITSGA